MRILWIAPDYYPNLGGYSNAITYLTKIVSKCQDIQVIILTRLKDKKHKSYEKHNNLEIYRFSKPLPTTFRISQQLVFYKYKKILKRYKFDLIFCETVEYGFLAKYFENYFEIPCVVRIHGSMEVQDSYFYKLRSLSLRDIIIWLHFKYNKLNYKKHFHNFEYVTSTTKGNLDFIKENIFKNNPIEIAKHRYSIIPNYMPHFEIDDKEVSNELKSIFKERDRNYFLQIGRMDKIGIIIKGFFDTIASIFFLIRENEEYKDKIRVIFVGSGNGVSELKQKINDLDLEENFIFLSELNTSKIHFLMRHSDCLLHPSLYEGLSMVLLEALSEGLPIITTSTAGGLECVVDGYNGYIFEPTDVEGYCKCTISFMTENKKDKFSQNSRELLKERFQDNVIKKLMMYLKYVKGVEISQEDNENE
jgi:glycosyltransferase involved in cell wall biosynthesis